MKTKILIALFVIALLPLMSFKHFDSKADKLTYYLYGTAILKEKKAMVYTPVYSFTVSDYRSGDQAHNAIQSLKTRLRNHVEGEMNYRVFTTNAAYYSKRGEAADDRSSAIALDKAKGYEIYHTTTLSFYYDGTE